MFGLGAFAPGPAQACGMETDCMLGERSYRLTLPSEHDGQTPLGAIIFVHGYRGSSAGVMDNANLTGLADRLGIAFAAVRSFGDDWVIPNVPSHNNHPGIDENAYFEAVLDDMSARAPIDRSKVLLTGFSAGGMMVWNLACDRGDLFAGFAPMSGTFWAPVPETCASAPVDLMHFHGTNDKIVPIEGRAIADTRQGDVNRAIDMLTRVGNYGDAQTVTDGDLDCTRRQTQTGESLEFCLFEGGHEMRTAFIERAWNALLAKSD